MWQEIAIVVLSFAVFTLMVVSAWAIQSACRLASIVSRLAQEIEAHVKKFNQLTEDCTDSYQSEDEMWGPNGPLF